MLEIEITNITKDSVWLLINFQSGGNTEKIGSATVFNNSFEKFLVESKIKNVYWAENIEKAVLTYAPFLRGR